MQGERETGLNLWALVVITREENIGKQTRTSQHKENGIPGNRGAPTVLYPVFNVSQHSGNLTITDKFK